MNRPAIVVLLAVLSLHTGYSLATVPARIGIQGRLTDSLGNPFPAGGRLFKFAIFDSDFGGSQVWPDGGVFEQQTVPTDGQGLWSHQLGSVVPLGYTVFAGGYLWLEIRVDTGSGQEVTLPRLRFVSAAYSHQVGTVDGASGGVILGRLTIGTNDNFGTDAFVAGNLNTALSSYASVTGGQMNSAGVYSTVSGGLSNYAINSSFIGGGTSNYAVGDNCAISGGSSNQALGAKSIVSGGEANIAGGDHACVGGGSHNNASGGFSFIGGGGSTNPVDSNAASGLWSSVVGGARNSARGSLASIGGGYINTATGARSVVGGGSSNLAGGDFAVIPGGSANSITGGSSVIGGGESNLINGFRSTIPGGSNNTCLSHESFAAGLSARANHRSCFIWNGTSDPADSFVTTGVRQFLVKATGGVGINTASPRAPLHVMEGSAGAVTAADDASVVFERSNSNYIHMLNPDNLPQGIIFGSPANSQMGGIRFNSVGGGFAKGLGFFTGNNNQRMTLDSLGNLTVAGCVSASNVLCPSDARFKREIQTLPNALGTVEKLRGVSYEWRTDEYAGREFPEGEQIGLVAQEVREIVPQAVVEQKDGYLAVDYARLVPWLIESIKEQQKMIEKQDERIVELEARMRQLAP